MAGDEHFDVLVIGGGQAGLATGYHLAQAGLRFVILDAGARTGDPWRQRWDSLRLFTPARINGLPGMPYPAPPGAVVTRDEIASYMESYAQRFGLPIRHGMRVDNLTRADSNFVATSGTSRVSSDQVVVATGSYPTPRLPAFASELDSGIAQFHSTQYRNPSQLQGDVLVVGAGNSGAEIAMDAAQHRKTFLAGRKTGQIPYPLVFTRPVWWVGQLVMSRSTPIGRRMAAAQATGRGQPLVRIKPEHLAAAGVERMPRVVGTEQGKPKLEGGRILDIGTVVWCTGFDHTYPWIEMPISDDAGHILHTRGVVDSAPGLYFVGLPFQHRISSSLIGGVGEDARYVVEKIVARRSRA